MKNRRWMAAAALAAGLAATGSSLAADVGFSLNIGEPGFFGRLDVGDFQPQLINRRPVVIQRGPAGPPPAPVYLHVRPGDERDWKRHCREYNACGEPVYFVRDDWYRNQYVPKYRERHGGDRHDNDRRDERRDHDEHQDHH